MTELKKYKLAEQNGFEYDENNCGYRIYPEEEPWCFIMFNFYEDDESKAIRESHGFTFREFMELIFGIFINAIKEFPRYGLFR